MTRPDSIDDGSAKLLTALGRSQDPNAWEEILSRYGAQIRRVVRRILMNTDALEDACQEAILQIREYAHRFQAPVDDPDGAARSWILRVAANTALKMIRSRVRARQREARASEMRSEAYGTTEPDERRGQVFRALEGLPHRDREVVLLRFMEGLPIATVAKRLECPEGTAKARVHRALKKLRHALVALGWVGSESELETYLAESLDPNPASTTSDESSPVGIEHYRELLAGTRRPALTGVVAGGYSIMFRLALSALGLALAGGLIWAIIGFGEEEPAPGPTPVVITKTAPETSKTAGQTGLSKALDEIIGGAREPGDLRLEVVRGATHPVSLDGDGIVRRGKNTFLRVPRKRVMGLLKVLQRDLQASSQGEDRDPEAKSTTSDAYQLKIEIETEDTVLSKTVTEKRPGPLKAWITTFDMVVGEASPIFASDLQDGLTLLTKMALPPEALEIVALGSEDRPWGKHAARTRQGWTLKIRGRQVTDSSPYVSSTRKVKTLGAGEVEIPQFRLRDRHLWLTQKEFQRIAQLLADSDVGRWPDALSKAGGMELNVRLLGHSFPRKPRGFSWTSPSPANADDPPLRVRTVCDFLEALHRRVLKEGTTGRYPRR